MRMLRQVVPRPELKYHEFVNGPVEYSTNTWTQWTHWNYGFQIPQGDNYFNREGIEIRIKSIQWQFETELDNAVGTTTVVGAGVANFSNTVFNVIHDQCIRLVVVEDMIDTVSGNGVNGFPLKAGSSTQSNAPGGASQFYYPVSYKDMKAADRKVYLDKTFWHYRAPAVAANPAAPATALGTVGYANQCPAVKTHVCSIRFPGKGKTIRFHSGVALPISQPVCWVVGKNNAAGDSPKFRMVRVSVYYTDV